MAELIGVGRCPIGCGSTKARYTLSAKSLTVGTCNACNTQVFARSDRSDELLRANIRPASDPAPEPAPVSSPIAGKPDPEPTPEPVRTGKPLRVGFFGGLSHGG